MSLLAVNNLTKNFGGVQALNGVSFTVEAGRDPGSHRPQRRRQDHLLQSDQRPHPAHAPAASSWPAGSWWACRHIAGAARGLARTFQNIQLFGGMTVLENVLTGNHLGQQVGLLEALLPLPKVRRAQAQAEARARELLRLVGLEGKGDLPADSLAYGEQRRLEIGRALALGPQLLLLDEPAAGLNPRETEDLMGLMEELRGLGITLLVIEHDMTLVMGLCDRIVVLDHGEVIASRPAPGDSPGPPGHRGLFGPGGVSCEQ